MWLLALYIFALLFWRACETPWPCKFCWMWLLWGLFSPLSFRHMRLGDQLIHFSFHDSENICTPLIIIRWNTGNRIHLSIFKVLNYMFTWELLLTWGCGFDFKCMILKCIAVIIFRSILSAVAFMWMAQYPPSDKSTLVQVVAWCHQVASRYLNLHCPRSIMPYGITKPLRVNQSIITIAWNSLKSVIIMACCLFSNKPISELMLISCQLDPPDLNALKFKPKYKSFLSVTKYLHQKVALKWIIQWKSQRSGISFHTTRPTVTWCFHMVSWGPFY